MSGATPSVPKVWTIRQLLQWSRGWFEERGVDSPRLTGELLLAHVLGVPRIKLYVDIDRPLQKEELARYRDLVQRRARGEPTQYVIGTQEFYGRTFASDRRALIPRPETELVAERALRALGKTDTALVADIGCGTGALGLTIAAERPAVRVVLTDVSPDAAALARENADRLQVSARVEVREGDLTTPLGEDVFDVIVTNLPYVAEPERAILPIHIRDHEPGLALFAGADGLDLYRRLLPAIAPHLRSGGLLVMEHGEDQGAPLNALFDRSFWQEPVLEKDLARLDRFTWVIRR